MSTDNKLPAYTRVAITHDGNPWVVATFPNDDPIEQNNEDEDLVTPHASFFARAFARIFGGAK